jgi:hypothetical protein
MVEDYLALDRRIVDPNRAMHAVRRAS